MSRGKKLIEKIFDRVFSAVSCEKEWQRWSKLTLIELNRIKKSKCLPKELTDKTEIKYYSWLSDEILAVVRGRVEKILEVGCGSGALSLQLCVKTKSACTVLDNDKISLDYASLTLNSCKATFVQGDATNLPFEEGSYDLVHSVGLLEHFSDEVIFRMVSEMGRVMRKRGYLYLAVPNYFSPDLISIWRKYGKGSERYIPTRLLGCFLSRCGLEVVDHGHCGFSFGGSMSDFLPVPIERALGHSGLGFLNYAIGRKMI